MDYNNTTYMVQQKAKVRRIKVIYQSILSKYIKITLPHAMCLLQLSLWELHQYTGGKWLIRGIKPYKDNQLHLSLNGSTEGTHGNKCYLSSIIKEVQRIEAAKERQTGPKKVSECIEISKVGPEWTSMQWPEANGNNTFDELFIPLWIPFRRTIQCQGVVLYCLQNIADG